MTDTPPIATVVKRSIDKRPCAVRGVAMLVGVIVLAIIAAPADAEMYGDWGLDMTERGSVMLIRHAGFINEGTVAFICTKRQRAVAVSIIPPKELYANSQKTVKVVATHGEDDSLLQEWGNAYEYIFQNDPEAVSELVNWLKTFAAGVNENVGFMFSAAFDGEGARHDGVLLIQVRLKGFAQGYDEFDRQCAKLQ